MVRNIEQVIVLVGPTCVGKTGAAIALAKRLGTEIISADSMQIYRHMDIGTEKPSATQLTEVRHHMIDIIEPSQSYSAGRYIEDVSPIIEGLHARGRVPVVTGGTGLYIKAMTRGIFKGPSADWMLRDELKPLASEELYARLKKKDPETAEGIKPTDKRRIIRALEVCIKSGRRMSDLKREQTVALPYEFIKVSLSRDREGELYPMIEARVDEMLGRGLLDEVKQVLRMNPSQSAMQAIGYKELKRHLDGEFPLDEAVALMKRNTRHYAKRQYTWFRKEEGLRWVDITGLRGPDEILEKIMPLIPRELQS